MTELATQPTDRAAVRQSQHPSQRLAGLITRMAPDLARALPKHITADRMARIALTAIKINPQLVECTEASFLGAVMTAAQLGLEVNTPLGLAYLIPFNTRVKDGRGGWRSELVCTLIVGYQGYIELARRSGVVTAIYAYPVHDGDAFEYELGLKPDVRHTPSKATDRTKKPVTHVYAVAKQSNGEPIFVVLTWADVMDAKARSRGGDSGPWKTDTIAMALKTAVRRLWKWLPKSIEMQRAAAIDATDDTQVRVTQAAAYDPEITAALDGAGLAIETEAEHVALPAAASPAAAFNREAPADKRGWSSSRGDKVGRDLPGGVNNPRADGANPIEDFLARVEEDTQ